MSNYFIKNIFSYKDSKSGKRFAFEYKVKDPVTGIWPKRYTRKSSASKKDLMQERNQIEAMLKSQVKVVQDAFFSDIALLALKNREKSVNREVLGIRHRTHQNDVRHIKLHLDPYFGHRSIKDITTGHINNFIEEMANKGKSAKLIRHCINTLNMVLKFSINHGYIAINPNDPDKRIEVRGKDNERGGYSHEHISLLISVDKNVYMDCFIKISAFTGLSANELQGLQWSDINIESREIRVQRTIDNKGGMQDTKSYFRKRSLGIPEGIINNLRQWKLQCKSSVWVFPNFNGEKPFEQNAMRKNLKKICVLAGVPDYGIGGFRKYFNTSMIGEVPDHIRKARMGHSKHSKTAEINYTIVDLEMARSPKQVEKIYNKVMRNE